MKPEPEQQPDDIQDQRDLVLVAMGSAPLPGLIESLDRLHTGQVDSGRRIQKLMEGTNILSTSAGVYLLLRTTPLTGTEDRIRPILLQGCHMEGVSNFCFKMDGLALADLRRLVTEVYNLKEGTRKRKDGTWEKSWLAPELQKIAAMLRPSFATAEEEVPAPRLPRPEEGRYDRRLADDALPVLIRFAAGEMRGASFDAKARELFQKAFDDHYDTLKNDDDRILAKAVLDLITKKKDAAASILESLRQQRAMMAMDPRTPPWREALTDIVMSQAHCLNGNVKAGAIPYAKAAFAILETASKKDGGFPNVARNSIDDELGVVALAWKAHIATFVDAMGNDVATWATAAKTPLEEPAFRQNLGVGGEALLKYMRQLAPK